VSGLVYHVCDGTDVSCILDFKYRCSLKLESLGDAAMSAVRHDDAISHYSAALSFDPSVPQGLFIKRSKAYIATGLWGEALNDANKVLLFVPSTVVLVDNSSLGDHARSIIPMGLRDEARSLTRGRRLRQCDRCVWGDALEDGGVT